MNILIIEPFFTGSHASWARGIEKYSSHNIKLLTMPGRNWKWRMHGASITLAKEFLSSDFEPNLIIATDMLDLTTFLGLTREKSYNIPVILYFHENQLSYPWSPTDNDIALKRDAHYSFINYSSSLAADYIFFNSEYNRSSYLMHLPEFLKKFPDYNELSTVDIIENKSSVLPLGIDLNKFKSYKTTENDKCNKYPVVLWNHRWEYDKNAKDFFEALYVLSEKGLNFKLVVIGENFGKIPQEFMQAEQVLAKHIIKFGYAESFEEYASWLWKSNIIPVTSIQEFFGISIVEAVYCNCIPLLPKRLTYPTLFSYDNYKDYFYENNDELINKLAKLIKNYEFYKQDYKFNVEEFDWNKIIIKYDNIFKKITKKTK